MRIPSQAATSLLCVPGIGSRAQTNEAEFCTERGVRQPGGAGPHRSVHVDRRFRALPYRCPSAASAFSRAADRRAQHTLEQELWQPELFGKDIFGHPYKRMLIL
jgi:hypothetical protein